MTVEFHNYTIGPALQSLEEMRDLLESSMIEEMSTEMILKITARIRNLNETIQSVANQ